MAERASNSAYLTVLEAVPLENVGWYARVLSERDYASVVGEVTKFVDLGFTIEANDCGGGKITLDSEATVLTGTLPLGEATPVVDQEALWQIIEDGVVRAEFLAEDVVEDVIVDDDGRRGTVINGRGTGCVLEWAKVLPEGMPNPTSTEREFYAHPLSAWYALFLEAQAAGFITWVQPTFGMSEDSAGQPWEAAYQTLSVRAGEDLLALLNRWCDQMGCSWRMLPGWKLQVFQHAGHHREHEVVFTQHRQQKKHDRTVTRRELANVIYADGGDGGIAVAASTSSQAKWRKRAAWVSAGDSGDATARSAVANAVLAQSAQPRESRSVQVPLDRPGRRPFIDFDVHDWITIETERSAEAGAHRVVAIAVEVGESGEASGELTLQSKAQVAAVRLQRLIDKLGGSSTSGSGSVSSTPIPISKVVSTTRLQDLVDVDLLGIQPGDLAMWDGAKWVDATPVLDMLADVDTTTPPSDGDVLTYDETTGLAGWAAPPAGSGGGVTDHGALAGLGDDDHPQYAKSDGSRGAFAPTVHLHTALGISDSTVTGRALMTAADAAAARLAISASASDHTHGVDDMEATGTPDGSTFLRGDGSWAVPPSGGGATTLDGLSDVDTTGASSGDLLSFNGTVWAPVDAPTGGGGGIAPTLLDAMGDLIVASGNDVAARLPVGSTGQVLTVDPAETLGVKWATPASGTDPWTYAVASVETATSDSAASTACAGLQIPPLPDGIYEMHGLVRARSASIATGVRVGMAQGAGMALSAALRVNSGATANFSLNLAEGESGYAVPTQAASSSAAFIGGVIDGILVASSATGTVDVTVRSESAGTTVRVLPGSFIKWRKIA